MASPAKSRKKTVILRFLAVFVVATFALWLLGTWDEHKHPHKELDFSKPIYTNYGTIVCPQSLLMDPRANHDGNAVFDLFTSFTHREEKAHALGCEVLTEGLRVRAERMTAPFDDYVSISVQGMPSPPLFSMAGDLTNGDEDNESVTAGASTTSPTEAPKSASSAPQTEQMTPSATIPNVEHDANPDPIPDTGNTPIQPAAPKATTALHWSTQPNGSWELGDNAGVCATITLATGDDPNIHVRYGAGISGVYPPSSLGTARDGAMAYCQSLRSSQ